MMQNGRINLLLHCPNQLGSDASMILKWEPRMCQSIFCKGLVLEGERLWSNEKMRGSSRVEGEGEEGEA